MSKIYKVVLARMVADKLVLEEELQRLVNSDIETSKKVDKIKTILSEVTKIDNMVSKWNTYMGVDDNQNNDDDKTEN
jgi:hypothetical protein